MKYVKFFNLEGLKHILSVYGGTLTEGDGNIYVSYKNQVIMYTNKQDIYYFSIPLFLKNKEEIDLEEGLVEGIANDN